MKKIIPFILLFLLLGSIFDYSISSHIVNQQNSFAIFLSAYGQTPALLCLNGAGLLLFLSSIKDKKYRSVSIVLGIISKVICFYMLAYDSVSYMPNMNLFLSSGIALFLMVIFDILLYKISKESSHKQQRKMATFMILLPALSLLIVNIIKLIWQRPRMRLLLTREDIVFQPWWQIGQMDVSYYLNQGILLEEFKSFPSAHTASASCALILVALPLLNKNLNKYKTYFLIIALVITVLVALSRIIAGAHFLSDTTIGFGVSLGVYCLLDKYSKE